MPHPCLEECPLVLLCSSQACVPGYAAAGGKNDSQQEDEDVHSLSARRSGGVVGGPFKKYSHTQAAIGGRSK